jgi:hypothetical protein
VRNPEDRTQGDGDLRGRENLVHPILRFLFLFCKG